MKNSFILSIFASVLYASLFNSNIFAQCDYSNSTYEATWNAPVNTGDTVSTNCIFAGKYIRVTNMQVGEFYKITTPDRPYTTQISVYPENGGYYDGYSSSSSGLTFTPPSTGNYDMLINKYYCETDTVCLNFKIEKIACPNIENRYIYFSSQEVCPNEEINIYFANRNNISSAYWTLGDGTTSTEESIYDHTYPSVGSYPISLFITNVCGNDTTLYDTVYVRNDLPYSSSAYFDISENEVCPNTNINFYATSEAESYLWNLGDGTTSTDEDIYSHSYSTVGTYPISLTLTNACGNDTTLFDTVYVSNDLPYSGSAYFDISQNEVCPNTNINFYGPSEAESYLWNLGDGTTSTDEDIYSHSYSTVGTYPISLTLTNACGNDTTLYDTVYVTNDLPFSGYPSISLSYHEACPNTSISFQAQTNSVESLLWNFGDGTTSTEYYTNHSYSSIGTYTISLTLTNACGNDTTLYDVVNIQNNLPYNGDTYIYIYSRETCLGESVLFQSYGNGSYLWDFGDGTTSTDWNTGHIYSSIGTYVISLTLTNECGNDTTVYDFVTIGNDFPFNNYIDYSFNRESCPNTNIRFNAYNAESYLWNFGDGTSSTNHSANHSYSSSGSYQISLTVANACGNDTTIYDEINIINNLPITYADMSVYPNPICPGDVAYFYSDGSASTYLWNFGGQTSSEKNPTHSFSSAGSYLISLTLTNGCWSDTTIYDTLIVKNNIFPTSDDYDVFILNNACPNDEVALLIEPAGNGTYSINWGDGANSTSTNLFLDDMYDIAKHSYSYVGIYDITYTIRNGCGYSFTETTSVEINNDVEIDGELFWTGNSSCIDKNIDFFVYGASNYIWNFGDGTNNVNSNSSISTVSHTYSSIGTYSLKVTASNSCGNSYVFNEEITIDDCTSIDPENSLLDNINITIFPNPNNGVFNIVIDSEFQENLEMQIINLNGEALFTKSYDRAKQHTDQINLSKLAKGIYFVKIQGENSVKVSKIVVQ